MDLEHEAGSDEKFDWEGFVAYSSLLTGSVFGVYALYKIG